MARDIYIKFGETKELDPYGKPCPKIEGDSSDDEHFWWTEVRDCSFGIKAKERPAKKEDEESSDSDSGKKDRPTLDNVVISKKVDWGSADLFRLCCQAPVDLKTNKDIDPKEDKGQLEKVVIEVCRRSGVESEGRYSFVTITLGGVYVVKYKIDFGGPDPMETITLKYGRLSYRYISANPRTGGKMDVYDANNINGFPLPSEPLASISEGIAATGGSGGGGTVAPLVAPATGASGGGGSSQSAGPSPDAAIASNFPGFMSVAGNGILPD